MIHTCARCHRANPAAAAFCHFDGVPLGSYAAAPVSIAGQAFAHPFVFPSGQSCRTLAELASGCQNQWAEARELLRTGVLAQFLSGLGRADLGAAAQTAAHFPDPDRGLDLFLAGLPGDVAGAPRLEVQPAEVNLGVTAAGKDHRFTVELVNRGDRLIHGSLRCEGAPWLSVENAVGGGALIQFTDRKTIHGRVIGNLLQARDKPQEGLLVLETSGGNQTVVVRLETPVKPFAAAPLAGARTPRQLAEKAKSDPKAAGHLFQTGAIARWYQDNGWTYPVTGTPASGLAAVQQYFEALGLSKAPRVEISDETVTLTGPSFAHTLEVRTSERRAVYASAVSDQPWLHVGPATLHGPVARIPLWAKPPGSGPDLAQVQVTANGNQRFSVTVVIPPNRNPAGSSPLLPPLPPSSSVLPPLPSPAEEVVDIGSALAPVPISAALAAPDAGPRMGQSLLHLAPVAVLALILLGLVVRDALSPSRKGLANAATTGPQWVEEEVGLDPTPRLRLHVHDGPKDKIDRLVPPPSMRFGLSAPGPDGAERRLTFDRWGRSNNTCLRIDGKEVLIGDLEKGRWAGPAVTTWREGESEHRGSRSVYALNNPPLRVTQTVEVVPGQLARNAEGKLMRLLDTCLVRYAITNEDTADHSLGARFLLDTFIGANDGVPFLFPGEVGGCDTSKVFEGAEQVPDYILALERNNLAAPGTVAKLGLRLGGRLQPPDRVVVGAWPDGLFARNGRQPLARGQFTFWEVPVLPMRAVCSLGKPGEESPPPDSAVTIYWNPRGLAGGATREVGFSYGLGSLASSEAGGKLGLVGDEKAAVGQEFIVQALVSNPARGQTLELATPAGLTLVAGNRTQPAPPAPAAAARALSTVTWKLKGARPGVYTLAVRSSTGPSQSRAVRIVKPEEKDFWDR